MIELGKLLLRAVISIVITYFFTRDAYGASDFWDYLIVGAFIYLLTSMYCIVRRFFRENEIRIGYGIFGLLIEFIVCPFLFMCVICQLIPGGIAFIMTKIGASDDTAETINAIVVIITLIIILYCDIKRVVNSFGLSKDNSETAGKRYVILGILGIGVFAFFITLSLIDRFNTVAAEDFLADEISVEGYTGYGDMNIDTIFDMDSFVENVCKEKLKSTDADYIKVKNAVIFTATVNGQKEWTEGTLENGDVVIISVECDEDDLEEFGRITKNASKEYIIDGLKEIEYVDSFDKLPDGLYESLKKQAKEKIDYKAKEDQSVAGEIQTVYFMTIKNEYQDGKKNHPVNQLVFTAPISGFWGDFTGIAVFAEIAYTGSECVVGIEEARSPANMVWLDDLEKLKEIYDIVEVENMVLE